MEDAAWPSGSRIVQEMVSFDSKMKSWGRGSWIFPLDGSSCSNSSPLQHCCCREGPGSSNRAQSGSWKTKGFSEQQVERNVYLIPLEITSKKKDGVCAQSMSYSTPNLPTKLGNEFFIARLGKAMKSLLGQAINHIGKHGQHVALESIFHL